MLDSLPDRQIGALGMTPTGHSRQIIYHISTPVILAGELGSDNVVRAVGMVHPPAPILRRRRIEIAAMRRIPERSGERCTPLRTESIEARAAAWQAS
ncbi:hypothetical protein ACVIIW_003678 [Bradyrhizobium sp. USDA 4449]